MPVLIPWNRPGFLQGAHPLLLSYLHGCDPESVIHKTEHTLDNIEQRLQRIKYRTCQVLLKIVSAEPGLSINAAMEFLANRSSLSLSELFLDDSSLVVFTHTAVYPLETRFVLHYENPITLFFPFLWYGTATRNFRLYQHPFFHFTRAVLESESCELIFCHMKTFVDNLRDLFRSDKIAQKTRLIRPHIPILTREPRKEITTFMFSNSIGSTDERFFLRGGLAAISAFLAISRQFPSAKLIVLSHLPKALPEHLRREIQESRNITIVRQGIGENEMATLCAGVDVLLNPSTGLHSMNILRAMSAGSIVVTSDIVGNDEYITHGSNGIVIPGVQARVNFRDPDSGLICEDYSSCLALNNELIQPLSEILEKLLSHPEQYYEMRLNAIRYIEANFSYGEDDCNLWKVLNTLPSRAASTS